MNKHDLELFVEVARMGGFAAVARARNLDPSAVSRAVAGLEAQIGVRLFQRSTRKMTLTEAGRLLLARASTIVADLDAALDDVRAVDSGPRGTLRITASNAFGPICIAPSLAEFHAQHPQLAIELVLSDDNLDLVAERIDMAVRLGPADDQRLAGTKLFDTHYRVCASPAYLARARPLRQPADLSAHRCLLFPFGDFRRRWKFESRKQSETVAVDGHLISASALSLRAAALAGMGVALLPSWLVDGDIAAGSLSNVFVTHRVTATTFDTAAWILYPSRKLVPAKVRAMSRFLRAKLQRFAPR
jgi:DNA-binding transcriptional LysR family regulator